MQSSPKPAQNWLPSVLKDGNANGHIIFKFFNIILFASKFLKTQIRLQIRPKEFVRNILHSNKCLLLQLRNRKINYEHILGVRCEDNYFSEKLIVSYLDLDVFAFPNINIYLLAIWRFYNNVFCKANIPIPTPWYMDQPLRRFLCKSKQRFLLYQPTLKTKHWIIKKFTVIFLGFFQKLHKFSWIFSRF